MNLKDISFNLTTNLNTEREKVLKIHEFVREKIKYGFTRKFDAAGPEYTITSGFGHSIPQTILFQKMLEEIEINSLVHFVTISKEMLWKTVPDIFFHLLPPTITHAYIEVNISGRYFKTDSYVIEKKLLSKAKAKLIEENMEYGYGTFAEVNLSDWDGSFDLFTQFRRDEIEEDHGSFSDYREYLENFQSYKHKLLGVHFSQAFEWASNFFHIPFEIWVNSSLNHYRSSEN
jgi:hypothetical protein